jgi:hypothetical protein
MISGLLSACSPEARPKPNTNVGVKNEYPKETKDTFLQACEKQTMGRHDFCDCLFDKVQRRYTFEQFQAAQQQDKFEESQEFLKFADQARGECMESSSHD